MCDPKLKCQVHYFLLCILSLKYWCSDWIDYLMCLITCFQLWLAGDMTVKITVIDAQCFAQLMFTANFISCTCVCAFCVWVFDHFFVVSYLYEMLYWCDLKHFSVLLSIQILWKHITQPSEEQNLLGCFLTRTILYDQKIVSVYIWSFEKTDIDFFLKF